MVRGDVDGFFGLALDNLVQFLLIDALCRGVLGFPAELVYGRVLPGAALSLLVGNVYYAFQAGAWRSHGAARRLRPALRHQHRLALRLRVPGHAAGQGARRARGRGRSGARRLAGGARRDASGPGSSSSARRSWPSACAGRRPRAALLSTLAGIALSFISIGFLFRTFAQPVIGLTTLAIVMLTYFGRVRFKGGLPGGWSRSASARCWPGSPASRRSATRPAAAALHLPVPVLGDLLASLGGGHLVPYLSVIVPMGLFNVLGSLQNIESAEAAGDAYDTRSSLVVNGIGSLAAALFGSASRRRSTSATPAGRRWARAPATRS